MFTKWHPWPASLNWTVTQPFYHCPTDEGTAGPNSRLPLFQGCLDRHGPVICAGWSSGLAHLVGLLVGRHGARHLLHHLRHQHGSLRLLCPHQTGKSHWHKTETEVWVRKNFEWLNTEEQFGIFGSMLIRLFWVQHITSDHKNKKVLLLYR